MTTVYRPGSIHDKAFNDECTVQIVSVPHTAGSAMPRSVVSGDVLPPQVIGDDSDFVRQQLSGWEPTENVSVASTRHGFFTGWCWEVQGWPRLQRDFRMNHEFTSDVRLVPGSAFLSCSCRNSLPISERRMATGHCLRTSPTTAPGRVSSKRPAGMSAAVSFAALRPGYWPNLGR